jgi:hypothetical protein
MSAAEVNSLSDKADSIEKRDLPVVERAEQAVMAVTVTYTQTTYTVTQTLLTTIPARTTTEIGKLP